MNASAKIAWPLTVCCVAACCAVVCCAVAGAQENPSVRLPAIPSPEGTAAAGAVAESAGRSPEREMLSLLGMSSDRLATFKDGREVDDAEQDSLRRLLFAVWRFKGEELKQWRQPDVPWANFGGVSTPWRGELFDVRGWVRKVSRVDVPADVAAMFVHPESDRELDHYYRCEVELGDEGRAALIYAVNVPQSWRVDGPIRERVSATASLAKFSTDAAPWRPVFVAPRLAWHPETILGDLDMDYGLFDSVGQSRRLSVEDRPAFYALLDAAGRAGAHELLRRVGKPSPVTPLFPHVNAETKQRVGITAQPGDLLWFHGTARRCVLINVDDPEIVAIYGFDRYHEIELFTEDSQNNPITVCVHDLPPDMPTGPDIYENIHVAGFYLKNWTYRRQALAREGEKVESDPKLQQTPLLIGRAPIVIPRESSDGWINILACVLFLIGLAGACLGVWWFQRGDERFHQQTIARKYDPAAGAAFESLADQDRGPVRFENEPS